MNLPQRGGLHVPLPTRWRAHIRSVIEKLSRHCDIGWMIHEVAIFRGARFLATKEALSNKSPDLLCMLTNDGGRDESRVGVRNSNNQAVVPGDGTVAGLNLIVTAGFSPDDPEPPCHRNNVPLCKVQRIGEERNALLCEARVFFLHSRFRARHFRLSQGE